MRCIARRQISYVIQLFRADESGVSLIEFALALPLFLTLVCGGLELANLAITQQRIAEIASQVAQNAARGTSQVDEADVSQIMTGAQLASEGTPILAKGRIILSSVRLNTARTGQWIEWQRCAGDAKTIQSAYGSQGKGKLDNSLQQVGPAPGLRAADGVNIMLVEVITSYQPLISNTFSLRAEGSVLKTTAAHVGRERTTFAIKNDGNLTASQIMSC